MNRRTLLFVPLALAACGKGGGSPTPIPTPTPVRSGMLADEMLRFLVQTNGGVPQTENDPVLWRKHDNPGLPRDRQISDSVFGTRNGVPVVIQTFDYSPWGSFDAQDGGDLIRIAGATAGIFYTRDGGAADVSGRWFIGPDCASPGWPLFGSDIDAAPRVFGALPQVGAQVGGLSIVGCPPFAPAMTVYRRIVEAPYDMIVVDHYGGGDAATAPEMERFFYARDLGKIGWSYWVNNPDAAALQQANDLLAFNYPAFVSDTAPAPGWVKADTRVWTSIQPEPGTWRVADFGWPPAGLSP